MGISMVGFATVATNLWFLYKPQPLPTDRIKEHIKCLVGAGISVYTAFFAFGAVRLIPELALQPGLWAVPLVVGLTLIIYHQRAVTRPLVASGAAHEWNPTPVHQPHWDQPMTDRHALSLVRAPGAGGRH